MGFVASVSHMFVHLVPERGSPQAHLRLEYVMTVRFSELCVVCVCELMCELCVSFLVNLTAAA